MWNGKTNATAAITFCCSSLAFAMMFSIVFARGDNSSIPVMANLRDAYTRNFKNLKSLRVKYIAYEAKDSPPSKYIEVEVAVKGQSRYISRLHITVGTEKADANAAVSFYNSDSFNVFRPYYRRYEVSHRFAVAPYTDKIRINYFLESLAWWPSEDLSVPPESQGYMSFLPQLFADDRYRVLSKQEVIQNINCSIIELPGIDRIWFDSNRGIIMKRQLFRGKEDAQQLVSTIKLSDFRKVDPGIWLPFAIDRQLHLDSQANTLKILEYHINDVSDEIFSFIPPPGTLVYARDNDQVSQVPGGLDFLAECIERARIQSKPGNSSAFFLSKELAYIACFICGIVAQHVVKRFVWNKT